MKLTGGEFINVCKATGRGRVPANFVGERPYDIKLKLEAEFDKYYDMVVSLSRSKRLTIPPLQNILDQIAVLPIKGSLVFPGIYGDAQTPIDRRKRVAMENQNIKKRVRRLVKSMGWEVQPSCTWCRHSFATNLTHAGVPHNYISESMGHSVDSNITNRYIDAFPLA